MKTFTIHGTPTSGVQAELHFVKWALLRERQCPRILAAVQVFEDAVLRGDAACLAQLAQCGVAVACSQPVAASSPIAETPRDLNAKFGGGQGPGQILDTAAAGDRGCAGVGDRSSASAAVLGEDDVRVLRYELQIWEKAEHSEFYATVSARSEAEARATFSKSYGRGYRLVSVHCLG